MSGPRHFACCWRCSRQRGSPGDRPSWIAWDHSAPAMILDWLKAHSKASCQIEADRARATLRQGLLWTAAPYQEEAPAITSDRRACRRDRAPAVRRLPALQQPVDPRRAVAARQHDRQRPLQDRSLSPARRRPKRPGRSRTRFAGCALTIRIAREELEKRIDQARRADLKLAQLASLSAESFEEFVAELFEMLDFEVEQVGRLGRRRRRPPAVAPRRAAGRRPVQVSQARPGRLARASEVPGDDSPHPQPQGLLRHDEHVLARRREVRRRKSDRAPRRPAARRADSPRDRARNRNARPSLCYSESHHE